MTPERLSEIERTCLQPVAVELLEYIRDLEAQAINADMGDAILNEIAGTLKELGCDCGPDAHLSTPPMFYREWMLCVMGSAVRKNIRDLEAQLAAAREAIHEAKTKLEAIPGIDWNGITPFNGVWNVLHKADYATPPSPEVK